MQVSEELLLATKKHCVPQADVVLKCKLNPVDNLRNLWHHSQNCDSDEVLRQVQRNTLK